MVDPEDLVMSVFRPNYSPTGLAPPRAVDSLGIPILDAAAFEALATRTAKGNLNLKENYTFGTRENPTIWYVGGNLTTKGEVTFTGYAIFIVEGNVDIRHSIVDRNDATETTLGFYAEGQGTFRADNLSLRAQVFTNKMGKFKGTTTLYGHLTAGDEVAFDAVDSAGMPLGPTYLHYRPASPALTEPFRSMNAPWRLPRS
ncbi:hypothetical protein [Rhodocaloribacter sp.]